MSEQSATEHQEQQTKKMEPSAEDLNNKKESVEVDEKIGKLKHDFWNISFNYEIIQNKGSFGDIKTKLGPIVLLTQGCMQKISTLG